MELVKLIAAEFWGPCITATIVMWFMWLWIRSRPRSRMPMLSAGAFPEISGHDTLEQDRLLREASVRALDQWRSFLPYSVIAIGIATSASLSRALSTTGAIPDSIWARAGVSGLVMVVACWYAFTG